MTNRKKLKETNEKLLIVANSVQQQVVQRALPSQQIGALQRGGARQETQPEEQADIGWISDYLDSEEEIDTPPASGDDGTSGQIKVTV